MNTVQDGDGRRLYKARGPDGEVAWVDHDELWRLQRGQQDELRRGHARRRRLLMVALAALLAVTLVLVVLRFWSTFDSAPVSVVVEAPVPTTEAAPLSEPSTAPMEGEAPAQMVGTRGVGESPAEEPAAEARPAPGDQVDLAVRTWAGAWERQDVDAYLDSYSVEFRPSGGMSRPSWEDLRRRRLLTPESIRLEIAGLELAFGESGRAEASFVQSYSSPDYSDVVRKRLELVEEDGDWRIVTERSEAP